MADDNAAQEYAAAVIEAEHVCVARHGGDGDIRVRRRDDGKLIHVGYRKLKRGVKALCLAVVNARPDIRRAVGRAAVVRGRGKVIIPCGKDYHRVGRDGGEELIHRGDLDRVGTAYVGSELTRVAAFSRGCIRRGGRRGLDHRGGGRAAGRKREQHHRGQHETQISFHSLYLRKFLSLCLFSYKPYIHGRLFRRFCFRNIKSSRKILRRRADYIRRPCSIYHQRLHLSTVIGMKYLKPALNGAFILDLN